MSNSIKFTDQELAEINMLSRKFQEKVFEFGKFHLERKSLLALVTEMEAREKKAEEEYAQLQKMEEDLLDRLTKKYGEGQLDLKDGTFIPASPPATPPTPA